MSRGCSSHRRRHPSQVFTGARYPRAASCRRCPRCRLSSLSTTSRRGDDAPLPPVLARAHRRRRLPRRLWQSTRPPSLGLCCPPTFGAHIRQPLPPLLPSFPLSYVLPPSSAGRCRAARYRAPLFPMRITHCHIRFPCPFLLVVLPAPRERRRHNTRTQNTPQSTTRV